MTAKMRKLDTKRLAEAGAVADFGRIGSFCAASDGSQFELSGLFSTEEQDTLREAGLIIRRGLRRLDERMP